MQYWSFWSYQTFCLNWWLCIPVTATKGNASVAQPGPRPKSPQLSLSHFKYWIFWCTGHANFKATWPGLAQLSQCDIHLPKANLHLPSNANVCSSDHDMICLPPLACKLYQINIIKLMIMIEFYGTHARAYFMKWSWKWYWRSCTKATIFSGKPASMASGATVKRFLFEPDGSFTSDGRCDIRTDIG